MMKKIIFGLMTLLALVAFSTNSYAGENNDTNETSEKCGHGKCAGDKKPVQKCGTGKCGGGK